MDHAVPAFSSAEYDRKIKQTLPHYEQFYEEVIELVKVFHPDAVSWLDIGCGTGKMGSVAFKKVALKRFVFCDSSEEMIKIAKRRFGHYHAEFSVQNVLELDCSDEFDVITAIQINHYLHMDERKIALQKCYEALRDHGLFISFENFAPFTDLGASAYLKKWKRYQLQSGKSPEECQSHIDRYGKNYFPISITRNLDLMRNCGFKAVEILWLSNMQVGLWGIK